MLVFSMPLKPCGKERARTGRHGFYTPNKTKSIQKAIALVAKNNKTNLQLIDEQISIEFCWYFKVPKSWSASKKEAALNGIIHPTSKPDIDNLAKIIFDSLEGVVYTNDKLITTTTEKKRYALEDLLEVTIEWGDDNVK